MKKQQILLSLAIIGVFLILSPVEVMAQGPSNNLGPGTPQITQTPNNVTVTLDNFTVRINTENYPLFSFWNEETPDERYIVHVMELIEFNDTNLDNTVQSLERAPAGSFSLASGDWLVSPITNITEDNILQSIHFNYTLTNVTSPKYENLGFQLRFHLYLENTTVESDNLETFVVGGSELKFDIVIDNWTWVSDQNQLALRTWVTSSQGRLIRHRHMIQNQHQTLAVSWEDDANRTMGYFRWEEQIALRNNTNVQISNVTNGLEINGTSPFLYFVYPYFEDQLVHDPTLGIVLNLAEETGIPSIFDFILHPFFIGGLTVIVILASVFVFRKERA